MANGFGREHALEILTDQQAGDAEGPAKELIFDGDDSNVVSGMVSDERRQHISAEATGQYRDRRGWTRLQRDRRRTAWTAA